MASAISVFMYETWENNNALSSEEQGEAVNDFNDKWAVLFL